MALRIVGRPSRKPTWTELRERIAAAVPVPVSFSEGDTTPHWVAWHEGPAIATVQARVGDTPGWDWAAVAPDVAPRLPPDDGAPIVWVRRSFSERALATALVRFQAAKGRPFTTAYERGRVLFAELCDVDDPARSGYPLVDTMVDLLLERPDPAPPAEEPDAVVDRLAGKLARLGYDNLWFVAFQRAP